MKSRLGTFFLFMITIPLFGYTGIADEYINEFKEIAMDEMARSGIPASIKLAQGLLESDWGRSELAVRGNNHFGIKCGNGWDGQEMYRKDDDRNKKGELIRSCFRKYKNARESYIAHSQFLTDPKKVYRYGFLFDLDPTDYKAWAKGLKKAGYATDPGYPSKLIGIIEKYGLHEFDNEHQMLAVRKRKEKGKVLDLESTSPKQKYKNGVALVYAEKGSKPSQIAKQYGLSEDELLAYNEDLKNSEVVLTENKKIFLTKRIRTYSGQKKEHIVKRGESMTMIAKKYGIQLSALYEQNRIPEGSIPKAGTSIKLDGYVQWGKRPQFVEVTTTEDEFLFADEEMPVEKSKTK